MKHLQAVFVAAVVVVSWTASPNRVGAAPMHAFPPQVHPFHSVPPFHRFHHFHDGQFFVGVGGGLVAAPYWYPWDPAYAYPVDPPYLPPPAYTLPPPPYWYYCQNPAGYYPDVPQCLGDWLIVVPQQPPLW